MTDVPKSATCVKVSYWQAMGNLGWRRIGLAHTKLADHLVGHSARSIRLSALKSPVFCPPSDRPTLTYTTLTSAPVPAVQESIAGLPRV